jgi:hypothetical protein
MESSWQGLMLLPITKMMRRIMFNFLTKIKIPCQGDLKVVRMARAGNYAY